MGDSLDDMIALRKLRSEERRERNDANAANADTTGWTQLSEHHFRRRLEYGHVDWWPRTKKFGIMGIGKTQFTARYRTGDPNAYVAKHSALKWKSNDGERAMENDHG